MTEVEVSKAKIGTEVYWKNDKEDTGLIADKTSNAIFIVWEHSDDGWIDNKDLGNVRIL